MEFNVISRPPNSNNYHYQLANKGPKVIGSYLANAASQNLFCQ